LDPPKNTLKEIWDENNVPFTYTTKFILILFFLVMGTQANINPLLSSNITCLEQFFILMKNLLSSVFLWQNKKKGWRHVCEKKKKKKKKICQKLRFLSD
jgi:hypothetical protein